MENRWQKDYPIITDLSIESDDNSSYSKMARFIGHDKYVVDFGCATGYFAQLLTQRGCTVIGVEVNASAAKIAEQYCEKVIVADLDFTALGDILPAETFDVAVFGDTLEHLRDPWRILEETKRIIKPDGYVVVSIPNIAHGAVRLALLQGRFEYEKYGLLDNTHLRFFTRKTFEQLFEQTGYFINASDRTVVPILSSSEFVPLIDWDSFAPEIIQQIEQEKDSDTLQFIARAFPATLEGEFSALSNQYRDLLERYKQLQLEKQSTQIQLKQTQTNLQQIQERAQADLQQIQERAQADLQQIQERAQADLQQIQNELNATQTYLQQVQTDLDQHKALVASQAQQLHYQSSYQQEISKQFELAQLQLLQAQNDLIELQRNREVQNFRIERLQNKIQQVRERQQRSKTNLESTKRELENARNEVEAMKTSKFWKLREKWFSFKEAFELKGN